jgi:hypothetical protein
MNIEALKAEARHLRTAIGEMFNIAPTHSQSLELIAKAKNYPNWDAASGSCREEQNSPGQKAIQMPVVGVNPILKHVTQHGLIIVAESGTGKHLHATHGILDQLQMGRSVVILDSGRSYLKIAEAIGGSYVWLLENGQYETRVFGQASLIVYDIERMPRTAAWLGALPLMPLDVLSDKGFIAIDEIGRVLGGVKSAMDLTTNIAKAGGSFLVVAQHEDQVKSFSDISVPFVMRMHLERR